MGRIFSFLYFIAYYVLLTLDELVTVSNTKYVWVLYCKGQTCYAALYISAVSLLCTSDLMQMASFYLADSLANCWGH